MAASTNQALTLDVTPFGDSALMLTINDDDPGRRRSAIARVRSILVSRLPNGVRDVVAGLESLLVEFDPLVVCHSQLEDVLQRLVTAHEADSQAARLPARRFVIPVDFRDDFAPDLRDVAAELGMSTSEVIGVVTSSLLKINLLAAAMAPMMEGVEFPTPVSRCAAPRTNVVPGSIMVAGRDAIIQPFPGPSGWKVIGRTPLTVCDINRSPATSYEVGDSVRLAAIPESEWTRYEGLFLESTKASFP